MFNLRGLKANFPSLSRCGKKPGAIRFCRNSCQVRSNSKSENFGAGFISAGEQQSSVTDIPNALSELASYESRSVCNTCHVRNQRTFLFCKFRAPKCLKLRKFRSALQERLAMAKSDKARLDGWHASHCTAAAAAPGAYFRSTV
jgi:hypothetical protein